VTLTVIPTLQLYFGYTEAARTSAGSSTR